jgi:hypothetical protein
MKYVQTKVLSKTMGESQKGTVPIPSTKATSASLGKDFYPD